MGELVQVHSEVLVVQRTDDPRWEVAVRSVSAEAGVWRGAQTGQELDNAGALDAEGRRGCPILSG